MSYKPKTRVVVTCERGVEELFSVRELTDGQLQILLKEMIHYEDPLRGNVKIVDEKYSIHHSGLSEGTTIKRSSPLEDGRFLTTSAFVENSLSSLLWLVYASRVPRFADLNEAKLRDKDRIVSLGKYKQSSSSLFFIVFVISNERPIFELFDDWINITVIEFKTYSLIVAYNYQDIPTTATSDTAILPTSPQQEVVKPIKPEGKGAISLTDSMANLVVDQIALGMCKSYFSRISKFDPPLSEAQLAGLKPGCFLTTKLPVQDIKKIENQFPIIFTSSLPLGDGSQGVVISFQGKACGKQFLDI